MRKGKCNRCEGTLRVLCECTTEGCCNCNSKVCIFCCYQVNYLVSHPAIIPYPDEPNFLLCRACGENFDRRCICCRSRPLDRCSRCCQRGGHITCCKVVPIKFVTPPNEPPFVGPAPFNKVLDKKYFYSREEALGVLTKQNRVNPKQLKSNNSTRFAAVEIEVSSIKNALEVNKCIANWGCAVVHDRTAGEDGFEINTTPACGDLLPEQLYEICDTLVDSRAKVTTECGLHVHVDCRDYGYQELQRFIRLYHIFEPALFAAVDYRRKTSAFCYPCGTMYNNKFVVGVKPETKILKKAIIESVYGDTSLTNRAPTVPNFHAFSNDHYGRVHGERNIARYSAINLHSYFLRGTVEFRMHHAAIDGIEVYGWTKILIDLMDKIVSMSSSEENEVLTKLKQITPSNQEFTIDKDLGTDTWNGVALLYLLLNTQCFAHLISKIELTDNPLLRTYLPANLFHNYRTKAKPCLDIDSCLTDLYYTDRD